MSIPLHLHKEFSIGPDTVIEVFLDQEAKVYLMDGDNYGLYCEEEAFSAFGGEAAISPFKLRPGHEEHWHLVVEQKESAQPLSVRVQLTQNKMKGPQKRKPLPDGRSRRRIPQEIPVDRVEVEEGKEQKTFVLCLNDVRKVVTKKEFRAIVVAAWKETKIRTHRSVIYDYLNKERQDIIKEVGILSDQSPILLELAEKIRGRYVLKAQ